LDNTNKTDKEIMWDKLKFVPVEVEVNAGYIYCPYIPLQVDYQNAKIIFNEPDDK